MSITISLNNNAAVANVFTKLGGDMSNARFVALALSTADKKVDLTINQQRAVVGSKSSQRSTVKAASEIATTTNGVISVNKSSVSTLITRAYGCTDAEMLDLLAFEISALTQYKTAILNGEVL